MPTFDAGEVVEALDYDFTSPKIGVPELRKAKGTIPEPSDAAIGRFLDGLKRLYTEAQKTMAGDMPADATADQMLEALNSLTGDSFVKFMADTAGLFAELCGGKPDRETLLLLPLRVRVKFFAWLQGEVVNPEAGPGAGNGVVKSLPSARAG